MKWTSRKAELCAVAVIQGILAVLLMMCACYPLIHDDHSLDILVGIALPSFQEVHLALLAGFALLCTFARRYMYPSLCMNMLLASLLLQWAILCNGFYNMVPEAGGRIVVNLGSLVKADITVCTVIISAGMLMGALSPLQMVVMGIIEISVCTANQRLGTRIIKAADAGGAMFVHLFGAAFGLAAAAATRRGDAQPPQRTETTDSFAMIGTVVLWCLWPTINSATSLGMPEVSRAMINTYFAMAASTISALICSALLNHRTKFSLVQVQNATLAGGVGVGASCDMVLHPAGAIAVGAASGAVSALSYTFLQPCLERGLRVSDMRGVVSAHGVPALLGCLASLLPTWTATEAQYGASLYRIFEGRVQQRHPEDVELTGFGFNRSAAQQVGCQLLGIAHTLVIALVSGGLTGLVLRVPKLSAVPHGQWYDDSWFWDFPEDEVEEEEYYEPEESPEEKGQPMTMTEMVPIANGTIVGDTLALVPGPEAAADMACDAV